MKKRKIKSCFALLLALGLVSCQNENVSSGESSSSESSSSESSSSEQIVTVNSLSEAIDNTSSYSLDVELNDGSTYVYQIFTEDFFYYRPNSEGYLILDSDPSFIHAYTTTRHDDNYYEYDMDVHGRNYLKDDRSTCFYVDFLDILREYADDFTLSDDRTYSCSVSAIGNELKEYFQSRAFAYTNYFEVKVGNDGRISSFTSYEKDESGASEYGTILFKKFDKENYAPYKKWKEEGSKINLRIIDLKTGYINSVFYKLCYENKEVEITGVVTSYDSDGNYYIANEDDVNGYVGIKVKPSSGEEMPTITDTIKVKGKVKKDGFVAYIDEASFEKVGENAYFPYFDEESIHSMYGGGYYAAYMFAQTPYYAGSLYSTYAYVNSLPASVTENEDTIIELACPAFKYTSGGYFKIGLELPSSLGIEKREEILESLKEYGVYSEEDNTAEEISFEKFVVDFDASYDNIVKLVYASGSEISKSLSPAEKVQKDFGLENFPFPNQSEYGCYHFGGSSGMYLESVYGKDGKDTLGIYYYAQSLSDSDISKVTSGLLSAGFTLSDEIKDASIRRHSIYKKDTLVVDILLEKNSFDGSKTINMWIYQGDVIYESTIAEILKEKAPYFDANDFVYADGTYSADYTYFGLPNMAGHKYEKGSYLTCIAIDLNNSSSFSDIRAKYRAEGYTLCRNEDGSQYSYRTRGQNHYVYYKEIDGSDEKVFVDLAQYPTTDYTFLNHSDFTNRVEVLIYKGKQPLSTLYETDLDSYFQDFNQRNGLSGDIPSFSLPVDTKVEMIYAFDTDDMDQYDYTRYGYYSYLQCYVYTKELSTAYTAIVDGLKKNGYTYYSTSEKGNECYAKEGEGDTAFVLLMKGSTYIRILEGLGGIDFQNMRGVCSAYFI